MKLKLVILFSVISAFFLINSCQKDDFQADNLFQASVNNESKSLSADNVSVKRGVSSIAGYLNDESTDGVLILTIKGDKPGRYRQVYDYKTGVSITECGLNYKILSRKIPSDESNYYVSFEGEVIIDKIDFDSKLMSGSYSFKMRSIPDRQKEQIISGKFINVRFK